MIQKPQGSKCLSISEVPLLITKMILTVGDGDWIFCCFLVTTSGKGLGSHQIQSGPECWYRGVMFSPLCHFLNEKCASAIILWVKTYRYTQSLVFCCRDNSWSQWKPVHYALILCSHINCSMSESFSYVSATSEIVWAWQFLQVIILEALSYISCLQSPTWMLRLH